MEFIIPMSNNTVLPLLTIGGKKTTFQKSGFLASSYKIEFNGKEIDTDIYRCIQEIVYESSEEMIDKLEISFINPDFELNKLKMFLPGNEVSVWAGYNGQVQFLGRGIIYHHKVFFPKDGMSNLEIKAYPKAFQMTEKRPLIKKKNERNAKRKNAVIHKKASLDVVLGKIADDWGFVKDIDKCSVVNPTNQPKTMSDYDFCTRLSNFADFHFWVDSNDKGKWVLHFRDPKKLLNDQEVSYHFKYNAGNETTLLEFEPEMVLTKQYAKVYSEMTLPNRTTVKANFTEDKFGKESQVTPEKQDEEILDAVQNPLEVKVFLDDISFIIPGVYSIKTDQDLQAYVDRWLKRNREEFIMGNGKTIGIPDLRARNEHELSGLGKLYDGKWYFTNVKHRITEADGYWCDFDARKEF